MKVFDITPMHRDIKYIYREVQRDFAVGGRGKRTLPKLTQELAARVVDAMYDYAYDCQYDPDEKFGKMYTSAMRKDDRYVCACPQFDSKSDAFERASREGRLTYSGCPEHEAECRDDERNEFPHKTVVGTVYKFLKTL